MVRLMRANEYLMNGIGINPDLAIHAVPYTNSNISTSSINPQRQQWFASGPILACGLWIWVESYLLYPATLRDTIRGACSSIAICNARLSLVLHLVAMRSESKHCPTVLGTFFCAGRSNAPLIAPRRGMLGAVPSTALT